MNSQTLRLINWYWFVFEQCVDGVSQVLCFDQRRALVVIQAAFVAEFAFLIEHEGVRRSFRAVGVGYFLGRAIVQIGEIKVPILSSDFHVGERIADIGVSQFVKTDSVGVVRLNRHERDAFFFVIGSYFFNSPFIKLGCGAVIAGENDDENLCVRVIA